MADLELMIPVANARPDYTVRSDSHTLMVQASFWFKARAVFSNDWTVRQLKEFAREQGVDPRQIYSITAQGQYPIYTK